MANEDCVVGVKHEEQIKELIRCYDGVAKDVRDIKERLLARPSWIITFIISFLSTLAFSALTLAFTVMKGVR